MLDLFCVLHGYYLVIHHNIELSNSTPRLANAIRASECAIVVGLPEYLLNVNSECHEPNAEFFYFYIYIV